MAYRHHRTQPSTSYPIKLAPSTVHKWLARVKSIVSLSQKHAALTAYNDKHRGLEATKYEPMYGEHARNGALATL